MLWANRTLKFYFRDYISFLFKNTRAKKQKEKQKQKTYLKCPGYYWLYNILYCYISSKLRKLKNKITLSYTAYEGFNNSSRKQRLKILAAKVDKIIWVYISVLNTMSCWDILCSYIHLGKLGSD